jgi:hypothetical protein
MSFKHHLQISIFDYQAISDWIAAIGGVIGGDCEHADLQ